MRTLLITASAALVFSLPTRAVENPEIFGAENTRTFPYSMCGQLLFYSGNDYYQGTGTVINSRSVLTAGHNLWDADEGWSYSLKFNRARHASQTLQKSTPSRIFVIGGYREATAAGGADTLRSFSYDIGGLRFASSPSDGTYARWKAAPALLTGTGEKICLGYGAEQHSGNRLLFVQPPRPFAPTRNAFYESRGITIEAGMSGGPVFCRTAKGNLVVTAVIVSGSESPAEGGVRIINSAAADFINQYLSL